MLLNDFYYIENKKQQGDTFIFEVKLHIEHPVFKGHFPGKPVVPGVCLIQMVKELVQVSQNLNFEIFSSSNSKFLAVINPLKQDFFSVVLRNKCENEKIIIKAEIKNQKKIFSKINLSVNK